MGAGRRTQTNIPWNPESRSFSARNLRASDLCGVIFGRTHDTMAECLSKQLFGLPYLHTYVKNIGVGLPLFLFNYSDRKLHGIFEAASSGQLHLNVSAWTNGNSERTPFPAQVRIRTRIQCEPLVEQQFKKIIEKNYYTPHHFWFELDNAQTRGLIALFKPSHLPVNSNLTSVASRPREIFPTLPSATHVALSDKGLPPTLPATTWKDVVSQNIKHVNPSENKFASLNDDGDSSENGSPIKTSSTDPTLPSAKHVALSEKGLPPTLPTTTWKDVVSQNIKHVNPSENKFASLCDDGDSSENGSPIKTSSTDPDDMESKDSVSDWEDLAENTMQNASSSSSAWSEGGNRIPEDQQYASKASESKESKFAVGYAHLNSSSNGCIHGVSVDCACDNMYQDSEQVLGKFSILSMMESPQLASDLNHGSAQDTDGSCASYFIGNAKHVEHTNAADLNHGNVQVVQFIKELKEWAADLTNQKVEAERKIQQLRNQLWYSHRKIGMLESRVKELEFKVDPSKLVDESLDQFVKQYVGSEDVIYLIGGFDGLSWLSALDCFSPSLDIITPLKSMNSAPSYASSVALDGNLFVFGGRSGRLWFDTVEYYNRRDDEWIACPSLLRKKGSLCGATLNGKIFAIGGGGDTGCLSEVETFDPAIGKWMANQPMLYKRFASTAAELKGAIYVLGGYDGHQYLRSAEKFDPRQGCWIEIPSMHTKRGSHALAVFNESLYCIGGYDGDKMVSSVEIFEPRMNSWIMGEQMKFVRGYAAAAVLGNSLFAIGGIGDDKNIVETVECYKVGAGWSSCGWKAIGKRCFFSAIVL